MPRKSKSKESEAQLVAACVAGDDAAWRRFYERYHPTVVRAAEFSLRRRGHRDPAALAQDVAADVFTHLLDKDRRALGTFEGRSSVATWLRVLTHRRAARVGKKVQPTSLAEPQVVTASDPSPSEVAQLSETQRILLRQLEELSARDRLALQLFYQGGRSYKQVAQVLDIPENRVGTLLARARKRLARSLGKRLDED